MSNPTQLVTRQVKPLLSLNQGEARARVMQLYKLWIRQIPSISMYSLCKYIILQFCCIIIPVALICSPSKNH